MKEQLAGLEQLRQELRDSGICHDDVWVYRYDELCKIVKADREVLEWYSEFVSHEEIRGLDVGFRARERLDF